MIAVVVLAAGESKRFGEFKLSARVCGKPMLSWVLESAIASRVGPVYVVTGYNAHEVVRLAADYDVKMVYNPWFRHGLSTSIKSAIIAAPHFDGYIFALGDMPFVRPETLRALSDNLTRAPIVYPVYRGRRGNPVLVRRDVLAFLLGLEGDVGARALLGMLRSLGIEVQDRGVVIDIDTRDDVPLCRT